MSNTDRAARAFCKVARPIILRWFSPNSCIASTRIAIECLRTFGVRCRPVPVMFMLTVPDLQAMFTSGLDKSDLPAHAVRVGSDGWNGHLVVEAAGALIDPSFDQALHALRGAGYKVATEPILPLFPVPGLDRLQRFDAEYGVVLDDGTEAKVRYIQTFDMAFAETPAWELDHIQPAIRHICREMRAALASC